MNFYVDPSFFVLAGASAIVAFVLGCAGRQQKVWSLICSAVLLVALFSDSWIHLAYFIAFVVLSLVLEALCLRWFAGAEGPRPHAVRNYRIALALQIAPLAVYKVCVVGGGSIFGFLGISYLTFKAVATLIETRDGLVKDLSLFDYLCFLAFFAPFTSGPIMRIREYLDDIRAKRTRDEYLELVLSGLRWIILGAVYKFVGSALATQALWFLPQVVGAETVAGQLIQALFYGVNLFFDFAGYSLMAMGLGAFFGVHVPRNFNCPFVATDMKDFWNRWHMSLSYWLRDYVFMRVSRSIIKRKLVKNRTAVACIAYMCNFVLMGAWHGLTPDYLVYGVFEGAALCATEVFQKTAFHKKHKKQLPYRVVSWAVTMVIVFIGLSLFSGQIGQLVCG